MLQNLFIERLNENLIGVIVSFAVVIFLALIAYIALSRKFPRGKPRRKFARQVFYISFFILLLIVIQIWVDGLKYIVAMFGIVSAGLILVNKELIMNLVSFSIIKLRGIFNEDDLIHIQSFIGYVDSVTPLHFRLCEASPTLPHRPTGKLIKVPNSLVMTNPVKVLETGDNIVLHHVSYTSNINSEPMWAVDATRQALSALLQAKYKSDPAFTMETIADKSRALARTISLEPIVEMKTFPDKENLVSIQASFYCYAHDVIELEQSLLATLMKQYGSS